MGGLDDSQNIKHPKLNVELRQEPESRSHFIAEELVWPGPAVEMPLWIIGLQSKVQSPESLIGDWMLKCWNVNKFILTKWGVCIQCH